MAEKKIPALSQKLRDKAGMIEKLLDEYNILRFGDETWRYGDKLWQENKIEEHRICEKCGAEQPATQEPVQFCNICGGFVKLQRVRLGTPPRMGGTPPQITVVSSPRSIFYEEEPEEEEDEATNEPNQSEQTDSEEVEEPQIQKVVNPLAQAAMDLGEITPQQAHKMELDIRYNLLTEFGVDERRNCVALVRWVGKLAGNLTYILETREIYSAEIKAVYPELLSDLDTARGACDQLAHLLSKQNGILTRRQFDETLVRLLHFTEIAKQAALQLADHHEEFLGAEVSPLEPSTELEWVLEKEAPKPPTEEVKEEKPKEEKEEK
jgi:hypothetical protein